MLTTHHSLLPPPTNHFPSSRLYQGPTCADGGCSVTGSGSGCPRLRTWLLTSERTGSSAGPLQRPLPEPVTCKQACYGLLSWPHPLGEFCSASYLWALCGSSVCSWGQGTPGRDFSSHTDCGPELAAIRSSRTAMLHTGAYGSSLFIQFSSVAQACPTLCDPIDCSTPGLPVHHQLPEFTHTHVH